MSFFSFEDRKIKQFKKLEYLEHCMHIILCKNSPWIDKIHEKGLIKYKKEGLLWKQFNRKTGMNLHVQRFLEHLYGKI